MAFYIWLPLSAQSCASTLLGLSLLPSLGFQSDDGVVWLQCVRHSSWINASSSVCLSPIHAGSTSLCRITAAVGKGTFVSAVADVFCHPPTCWGGLMFTNLGTALSHTHRRRCTGGRGCDCCCGGGGSCFPPEVSQQLTERES